MDSPVGWKIRTALGLMIAAALPLLLMLTLMAGILWQRHMYGPAYFDVIGFLMATIFSLLLACMVSIPSAIWLLVLHRRQQRKLGLHYSLPMIIVGAAICVPLLYAFGNFLASNVRQLWS